MCCNEEPYGPKARRARCIAIGALVLAIVGLVAIVAHRLYGLFACIGSALSLIAPSMLLCDGRSSKSMFKGAANTAFMSATVSFAGFLMIIYGLSGISSFYDNCKRQVCVEPKYSYYRKREVPGWQTAICDNMNERKARDCFSMSDCLSDQSIDLYCSYGLYELEGAVFWAVVGKHSLSYSGRTHAALLSFSACHGPSPLSSAAHTLAICLLTAV